MSVGRRNHGIWLTCTIGHGHRNMWWYYIVGFSGALCRSSIWFGVHAKLSDFLKDCISRLQALTASHDTQISLKFALQCARVCNISMSSERWVERVFASKKWNNALLYLTTNTALVDVRWLPLVWRHCWVGTITRATACPPLDR